MGLHNDFEDALGFVGNLTFSMPSVCSSYFLSSFPRLPPSFPLHHLPLPGPQLTHSRPQPTSYAHFFETVISYLGGLLSAHALSSSPILLSKADDFDRLLLPAFYTSLGLPLFAVNTNT